MLYNRFSLVIYFIHSISNVYPNLPVHPTLVSLLREVTALICDSGSQLSPRSNPALKQDTDFSCVTQRGPVRGSGCRQSWVLTLTLFRYCPELTPPLWQKGVNHVPPSLSLLTSSAHSSHPLDMSPLEIFLLNRKKKKWGGANKVEERGPWL